MAGKYRSMIELLRDRRGGTAVEYAFSLPIFLAIVLAVVELGRVLFTIHVMHHAAADGARFAIVRGTESSAPAHPADIESAVRSGAVIDQSRLRVTVLEVASDGSVGTVPSDHEFAPGHTVRIVTDYDFSFVVPIFDLDTIALQQFADMVILN